MLDWLGDVGGLFDALRLIARLLIGPIAALTLKAELLSHFFRYLAMAEEGRSKEGKNLLAQIVLAFSSPQRFMHPGYLQYCSKRGRRQRKFI